MAHQPSALITGSNRGIGFETARQLGKKGFYIFLAARKENEGLKAFEKLKAENIAGEFIQLDIASPESIQAAFEKVRKKISHLDVLINNAAILLKEDQDLLTVEPKIVSDTINTNVLGTLHVTQHFSPLLSEGSRVINISSGGGSMTDPIGGWSPVYCISKSAVNAITRHLAYYLKDKSVVVNAACPGWVRTNMGGRSATRSVEKGAETIVWLAADAPFSLTGKFFRDKKEIAW